MVWVGVWSEVYKRVWLGLEVYFWFWLFYFYWGGCFLFPRGFGGLAFGELSRVYFLFAWWLQLQLSPAFGGAGFVMFSWLLETKPLGFGGWSCGLTFGTSSGLLRFDRPGGLAFSGSVFHVGSFQGFAGDTDSRDARADGTPAAGAEGAGKKLRFLGSKAKVFRGF